MIALGSVRVSRVGFRVPPKQSFAKFAIPNAFGVARSRRRPLPRQSLFRHLSIRISFDIRVIFLVLPPGGRGRRVADASGTILATVMHDRVTTAGYVNVTYSLAAFAGQQIRVEFLDHSDGFGDITNMRVDDVSVQGVPEPGVASLALLGFGALAATGIARRMRRSAG